MGSIQIILQSEASKERRATDWMDHPPGHGHLRWTGAEGRISGAVRGAEKEENEVKESRRESSTQNAKRTKPSAAKG